jgi:hypothetical protein
MKRKDIRSYLFSDTLPPLFASLNRQSVARMRPIIVSSTENIVSAKTKIRYLTMRDATDGHSQAVEQSY